MAGEAARVARAVREALQRGDLGAAAGCFSERAEFTVDNPPRRLVGREQICALFLELSAQVEQCWLQATNTVVSADTVAEDLVVSVRRPGAAGTPPLVALAHVEHSVDGGLISRTTVRLDTSAMRAQWLGAAAIPASSLRSSLAKLKFDPEADDAAPATVTAPHARVAAPEPRRGRRRLFAVAGVLALAAVAGVTLQRMNLDGSTSRPESPAASTSTSDDRATGPSPSESPTAQSRRQYRRRHPHRRRHRNPRW